MLAGNKKVWTAKDLVTDKVMDILKPLYQGENYFFNSTTNDMESKPSEYPDTVKQYLLDNMAREAFDIFEKGNGLYSSALFAVANDYAEGVSGGMIPGLCYKEDIVKFYDNNIDSVIDTVDRLCEGQGKYFGDIPGYDSEIAFDSDLNKIAITKFVVDNVMLELRSDIQQFRDELEKIPHIKRENVSLRPKQNGKDSKENERE